MEGEDTNDTPNRRSQGDGEGLVFHAGAYLLVELADRLGLTAAMAPTRERRSAHDPGVVLRDLAIAIADGGDHVSDLGVLRGQQALFGAVASKTTAHRALKSVDADLLEELRAARAEALAKAWSAGARPKDLILDIDASLLPPAPRRRAPPAPTRATSAFTRCSATWPRRASRWPPSCTPAMPAPTPPTITSRCWRWRSSSCPPKTWVERSSPVPTSAAKPRLHSGLPRRGHPLLGRIRGRRAGARGDRRAARLRLATDDRRRRVRARGPRWRS